MRVRMRIMMMRVRVRKRVWIMMRMRVRIMMRMRVRVRLRMFNVMLPASRAASPTILITPETAHTQTGRAQEAQERVKR